MTHLNKKGQGTTEYIVILAIIVGLALLAMGPLKDALSSKISSIGSSISSAGSGN